MKKEIIETGKTVDAAIDLACEKLGCLREDCEWEIVDLPKKGFFGLKHTPAKVRVVIEVKDEIPQIEKPVREPVREENKPPRTMKPENTNKPKPAQPKTGRFEKPVQPYKAEIVKPGDYSEKELAAKEYLSDVISAFGLDAKYEIVRENGGTCLNVVGEGLGMIIGRRGETLDAIQHLTGLVANRGEGDYLRLTVDCGDYRTKRKDTLEGLAKKLAGQVLKTNVSKTLEPMNPFERRIIHAAVSEISGVTSSSIGEEPNRRVVITSPTAKAPSRGTFRKDDRGGGVRRGNLERRDGERMPPREHQPRGNSERNDKNSFREKDRGRRGPKPQQQIPQGPPKQTPEAEATTGISFGKIDLG